MAKRISPRVSLSVEALEDRLAPTGGIWLPGCVIVIHAPCHDPQQGLTCGAADRGCAIDPRSPPHARLPAPGQASHGDGETHRPDPWGPLSCGPGEPNCGLPGNCLPSAPKKVPALQHEIITVPNVGEDVAKIILRVKSLVVRNAGPQHR